MQVLVSEADLEAVALLAEGVDRNLKMEDTIITARVALLAEGVDRNISFMRGDNSLLGRPPRGGRG